MQQQQRERAVAQVFIGKVPKEVDPSLIEERLVPFGAYNVRNLPGKGCVFADFHSFGEAERCIQELNGIKLTAESAEGINVKFADQKGQPKGREGKPKVFIGGLAMHVTEEHVFQVASQFGNIVEAKTFMKRPDAPPCGFVLFSSFTEAELCIQALHGTENELSVEGKTLNVKFADNGAGAALASPAPGPPSRALMAAAPPTVSRPVMGGKGGGKPAGPFTAGWPVPPGGCAPAWGPEPMWGDGVPLPPAANPAKLSRPSNGGPGCPPPGPGCSQKLFVGGLPEAATEDFVWGLMAPYGEVVEAKIHKKNNANPCGFVRYSSEHEAEVAMASHHQLGRFTVKRADDNRGGQPVQLGGPQKRSYSNAFAAPGAGQWGGWAG